MIKKIKYKYKINRHNDRNEWLMEQPFMNEKSKNIIKSVHHLMQICDNETLKQEIEKIKKEKTELKDRIIDNENNLDLMIGDTVKTKKFGIGHITDIKTNDTKQFPLFVISIHGWNANCYLTKNHIECKINEYGGFFHCFFYFFCVYFCFP